LYKKQSSPKPKGPIGRCSSPFHLALSRITAEAASPRIRG